MSTETIGDNIELEDLNEVNETAAQAKASLKEKAKNLEAGARAKCINANDKVESTKLHRVLAGNPYTRALFWIATYATVFAVVVIVAGLFMVEAPPATVNVGLWDKVCAVFGADLPTSALEGANWFQKLIWVLRFQV